MDNKGYEKVWAEYEKTIGSSGTFSSVNSLCGAFWAWRMINWPEFASFSGCHEFDDRLTDTSFEAIRLREKTAAELLTHCQKINMSTLNEDDCLNLHLLKEELQIFLEGAPFKGYLMCINYIEGVQVDFEQLIGWMKFETFDDYNKYLRRLKALPKRVCDDIKLLEEGIRIGKVNCVQSMKGVLEQLDMHLATEYENTMFYGPFKKLPADHSEWDSTGLKEQAIQMIKDEVGPAFKKLRIFLENEYLPNCRKDIGICSIPGGKEHYQQCLKFHLSLDMTPEQVHELGRQEVARVRKEMDEVIKQIGFQGDFREFLNHLRCNEEFFFEDKETMLNGFRDICVNKIRPRLPRLFKKIPESLLVIEAIPSSRQNAPAGYYMAGTLDGSRPGTFYVGAHNLKNCPKYEMMTLALHEGEPGHHFQGMYAIEAKGVPEFRKHNEDMLYFQVPSRFPMHTAYVEGWGLYCEYLGNELGLYDEDLYSRFGHLSFEMHRACRLVADTGMHAMGWTTKKAQLLFMENTALSEAFINTEVPRYLTWPGQACAYKVGQIKLKQLRQKAENALGEKFDVREFHEVILNCLQTPLNVLDKIIDLHIEKQSKIAMK